MKDKYLKRLYRFDENDKSYHVVIDLDTYRDVYSEWDYSPYNNRDLDEDLLEYLVECSEEISLKNKMVIDFYVPKEIVDPEREKKSILGFREYFSYSLRKIKSLKLRKLKNSFFFFLIGVGLYIGSNILKTSILNIYLSDILSEGLFIGAWVAIWEIFSILFFEVSNLNYKMKHFKRLKSASIFYHEKKSG
jgi:hypothetical protein